MTLNPSAEARERQLRLLYARLLVGQQVPARELRLALEHARTQARRYDALAAAFEGALGPVAA